MGLVSRMDLFFRFGDERNTSALQMMLQAKLPRFMLIISGGDLMGVR